MDWTPRLIYWALAVFLWLGVAGLSGHDDDDKRPAGPNPRLKLETRTVVGEGSTIRIGTYRVYENRAAEAGRMLELDVVVIPATGPAPKPDPVFFLHGGPGVAAAGSFRQHLNSWIRRDRDIVLVSQRGTGGSNKLGCAMAGSDDDLQDYLEPIFQEDVFETCLEQLELTADLRMYGTPTAMDDLNEIRQALGYEKINLIGGSYGTRAALVYMRRHPETVRTAILNGVAPIAFTNPLYHARGAQEALDNIFRLCADDPQCSAAFPDLAAKFQVVIDRLSVASADVTVRHPETGEDVMLKLSSGAFAGALRIIMYSDNTDVPLLIHQAFEGNYDAIAQRGVQSARSLRNILSFGMLLCVTCAEDIDRIDPDSIDRETAGTFLGDARVREQMAVCEFWPRSDLPDNYGDPVSVDVPVLLLSGTLDPVTPPRWGEEAAGNLPNSLHVVAPGTHGIGGKCITSIMQQFLAQSAVDGLDTSCVETMRRPAFDLPDN